MKIALAGTGAFGIKHLDGLANIDGVTVTAVVSRRLEQAEEVARKYGITHATTDLGEVLASDVDAVILCTPTQLHASQAIAAMRAGKHVQVEIPVADSWADAQEVQVVQQETGLTCMVGHTRRFNPSHQWVRRRILAGELSIQLRTGSGKICTLSLSFNNDGPLGSFFRYICDNGTYIARYDDLVTGREEPVDVSKVDVSSNGIELQDREFVAAISEGREPNSSIASVLGCYRVLGELEEELASQR